MWSYRKRVTRDLERWREAGWVSADGAKSILSDVAKGGGGLGLPAVLAVLAAALIGFALMSFVAANWQAIPRIVRFGMLVGVIWSAYAAAAALMSRDLKAFGDAAVVVGSAAFGAAIMLVSQMYHIDGNPPDGVLLWAGGALLAGCLFRSNPALGFAMILVSFWGAMESGQRFEVFWLYLAGWAVVTAAIVWQRWAGGLHLAAFALTAFVVSLGYLLETGLRHSIVTLIGLGTAAAAVTIGRTLPEWRGLAGLVLPYALVTAFAGLCAMQFIENPRLDAFIMLAALALVLTLTAIWLGLSSADRGLLWLGYLGFSFEALAVYSKTVGTLLGSSVFFLTSGILLAVLAYLAYRLHARQADLPEALS